MGDIAYYAVFCVSVLAASVSQLLLKQSALTPRESLAREYFNFRSLAAYALFFVSTLLTVWAYRGVPLSAGAMLEAAGYVYVACFSRFVLREPITRRSLAGLALILLGILVYVA